MWGSSWLQRARLTPLYLALIAADRLGRLPWLRASPALPTWREGLSIVIPDRDAPAMLTDALKSLFRALEPVREPCQVIVVANGAPVDRYIGVRAQFPQVDFIHSSDPLPFSGAIERGLSRARHDWTFLLNNDMTLDPAAIVELLALRGNDVFAVASQIFQQNAAGRREETGFTDWYLDPSGLHIFHAPLLDENGVYPHLCASGGAALFRTARLQRYVRESRCYDPFYWEDVEWGVRGWRDGLFVLFCPRSRVAHRHRATTARFYPEAEIERIVQRNRLLFDARQGITSNGAQWLMHRVCALPYQSQRDVARIAQAVGVFRQRLRAQRSPQPSRPPALPGGSGQTTALRPSYSYRLRSSQDEHRTRRRMMLITPFAMFPPGHGGARRVAELIRVLRNEFDIVLISDEARLYDVRSFAHLDGLYAVYLVQRDPDSKKGGQTLVERIRTHCHPRLVTAVEEAMLRHRPDLVQVEHVELASLVRLKTMGQPWILGLHDAYGPADFGDARQAAAFATDVLGAYDAITVCSDEDRSLISHPRVVSVPNGSPAPRYTYRPSDSTRLLFIGPFRYAPNLQGILLFLAQAYPAIKAAVPSVQLLILGGDDATAVAARYPDFAQPGVEVTGHRDDVPALLAQSALSVNPLTGIRGSAIKLIESLTAGRVCVSTAEGARGFLDAGFASLITVPDVGAMIDPIVALLADSAARHRIEVPVPETLAPYQWDSCARVQKALYDELLRGAAS